MNPYRTALGVAALLACALILTGCPKIYYGALERVGIEKRDLMVDRVEAARDAQEDAKEQFQSALEAFAATVDFDGGELEATYERLNREYERSESRAEEVRERIEAVEDVAEALFAEWEDELDEYSDAGLRRASRRQLGITRDRYGELMRLMRRAESRLEPALAPMRDQVLFLKHNLNARAIAAIQGEVDTIEADVTALVRDIEAAVEEANTFIAEMEAPE
jgi:hypothetical protein